MGLLIDIRPVPKGRPKARRNGKYIVMYTPSKTRQFEEDFAEKCKGYFKAPTSSLIKIDITFYLKPAESFSTKKKQALYGKYFDLKNIDIDNLQKSAFDALNKIAYDDDSQIVDVHAVKKYAEQDYIEFEIIEIKD